MTLRERKAELRRHAAGLPQMEAGALFERFLALPEVEQADTVMVFYGTGREPDTVPLIRALLARGKRVALPVVLPHRGMEARQVLDVDQLVPNRFGIPEPDDACPVVPKHERGGFNPGNIPQPVIYKLIQKRRASLHQNRCNA